MKITHVDIFEVTLPTKGGSYRRAGALSAPGNSSVILRVQTDAGLTGLGEHCPIGTHYGPGWIGAARDGAAHIARMSLGEDPLQPERLNRKWDRLFRDDHYAKAAMDMALWDIIGQAAGRPVSDMLGGTYPGKMPLYRSVHVFDDAPTAQDYVARCRHYRTEGYAHFQLKCGDPADVEIARISAICDDLKPGEKLICDANGSWTYATALRVCNALRDAPVIIEQPCATLEECAHLRRLTPLPMKLDESIGSTRDLIAAWQSVGMDAVSIKIGRVGGLTKARRIRDLALDLGISVVADDNWGSEIVSASLAHFAQSTDPKYLLNTTDLTDYVTMSTATGFAGREAGTLRAGRAPGLGVTLRDSIAATPVQTVSQGDAS